MPRQQQDIPAVARTPSAVGRRDPRSQSLVIVNAIPWAEAAELASNTQIAREVAHHAHDLQHRCRAGDPLGVYQGIRWPPTRRLGEESRRGAADPLPHYLGARRISIDQIVVQFCRPSLETARLQLTLSGNT